MQLLADEATRQRQLDRAKRRATLLLVAAVIVYILARAFVSRWAWLDVVRAVAEASMVGGLADWFAVTALFRHPMGIPIPHTAIVPARKDRVGRTLGGFVQRNFLTRDVIAGRLASARVGERLAAWLAEPENARLISRQAAAGLGAAAAALDDDQVQGLIDRALADRIRAIRVAPLLGRILAALTENDRHQEVLNEVIALAGHAVDENQEMIRARIEKETPWWVPSAVDDRIFRRVVDGIQRLLDELSADPHHAMRERFDEALRRFIDQLNHSPELASKIEGYKEELIENEAARRFSASLWTDAKAALARRAEAAESTAPGPIEHALTALGEHALHDPALIARIDAGVADIAMHLVARYQDEVADLIAHTVASWDPEITSKRVELAIGRDLQYIRINGTLVGGLAGLLIYLVSRAFP
jgi:uncharacterized membrane-anchored protein YjiN (DUF445 family)